MKRGKRYSEALGKLDRTNLYTKEEADKWFKWEKEKWIKES